MTPKRGARVEGSMRRLVRNRRGLAEIVGTLMLVVIVVAAATAFSFFVAAYQKQLQANETLDHDRSLESIKVIGVSETTCMAVAFTSACDQPCSPDPSGECFAQVNFTVASLDVNPIEISSLFLNHDPIVNFTAKSSGPVVAPCYNESNRSNVTHGVGTCAPAFLAGFGTLTLYLDLDAPVCEPLDSPSCTFESYGPNYYAMLGEAYGGVTPTSVLNLQLLTTLGNEFSEPFTPPSAVASVFYVSSGTTPAPVFDGLDSYQPPGATNASILLYSWTISGASSSDSCYGTSCTGSGAEYEPPPLDPGTYAVTLEVTNSDGLSGFASLSYTQQ